MQSKKIEFKVGLFIIVGILILSWSYYWLLGYKIETLNKSLYVKFDDVGMMKVGDATTVSGVFKGEVNSIELVEGGVIVELLLVNDVGLKEDARFIVRNQGIMGDRFVAIYPGESDNPLDYSKTARGKYDSGMPEVLGLMGEMAEDIHSMVASFKKSVGADSTLAKLNKTINNLERVSISLGKFVDDTEKKFGRSADNFLNASTKLNSLVSDNSEKIDSSLSRIDRITISLEDIVIHLDSLAISARQFAEQLNNEDGTLQQLVNDGRLYDDLRKTADNLDDLISDIKNNPEKYINLQIKIF